MIEQIIIGIVVGVVCGVPGIVSAVICWQLQRNQKLQDEKWDSLTKTVDRHDEQIIKLTTEAARCKVDCTQTFATSEAFVREAGFTRRTMEQMTASLARLEGSMQVVNRLPEISGQIAANIASVLKGKN